MIIFLILPVLSCFAFQQSFNDGLIYNITEYIQGPKYNPHLTKVNDVIQNLMHEIDGFICDKLYWNGVIKPWLKQDVKKPREVGRVLSVKNEAIDISGATNLENFIPEMEGLLMKNDLRKHVKGDDDGSEEAVDGGKGSKKKKEDEPKEKPTEEVKIEQPSAPPPEPPPEPETKKPVKEFYGVGLSYYDSEDDDEDEKKEEPMCNWQNYLDKNRWLNRKDDEDDDKPPPNDQQVTVSTLIPGVRTSPEAGERGESKQQGEDEKKTSKTSPTEEHLADLLARVVGLLEWCQHCRVAAVSKQVAKRVGLLLRDIGWNVERGNRLLGMFNRIINLNKNHNQLADDVIGQMMESLPANQITRTMVPVLNSALTLSSSTQAYI